MRWLGRAGQTWIGVAALAATAVLSCALMAGSAGARVVVDKVTGQRFGIVPVPGLVWHSQARAARRSLAAAGAPTCDPLIDKTCASPLKYHGGPVQHAQNDYLFFWGPSSFVNSSYVTGMQAWLSSVAAGDYTTGHLAGRAIGNPLSVTQEYYDRSGPGGAKRFVPYAVRNAGTLRDTDPFPTSGCTDKYTDPYKGNNQVTLSRCLTAKQLITELTSYITKHNLPHGRDDEYFILTPTNVGSCDDSTSQVCALSAYCGWHSALGTPSNPATQLVFADLPWVAGTPCDLDYALSSFGTPYPGLYSNGIDPVVGVFSHELAETMTDPFENGWYGSGGGSDEIGDKCAVQYDVGQPAYQFAGLPQTATNAYYNTTLDGNDYLVQMEYDNRTGGCNQWDTDTQPTATISAPSQAASGVPATFSLSSHRAPAGIAYVTWNFGDGTTRVSPGAAAVQHAYPAGGSYTVTAIVTDNRGNEFRASAGPVTVTQGRPRLSIHLSNMHPAPNGAYTVKLRGIAGPGGKLGIGHNRTEVDLFEQLGGRCASSRTAESRRVSSRTAESIGRWFAAMGSFAHGQRRRAVNTHHTTVRFCGYSSPSLGVTSATASASYTTA